MAPTSNSGLVSTGALVEGEAQASVTHGEGPAAGGRGSTRVATTGDAARAGPCSGSSFPSRDRRHIVHLMTESRSSAAQNGQDFTSWVSTRWNPHLRCVEGPLTERTWEREGGKVSRQASLVIDEVATQELRVGELDRTTSDRFDDAVLSVIVGTGPLVLDLSRVLDSSGVRSLVKLGLSMRGRSLVLREPSPPVMRVLQMTRLNEVGLWQIDQAAASA